MLITTILSGCGDLGPFEQGVDRVDVCHWSGCGWYRNDATCLPFYGDPFDGGTLPSHTYNLHTEYSGGKVTHVDHLTQ